MSCKRDFTFKVTVPKGTPEHEPGLPKLLVVEDTIHFWGELISYEFGVTRDGKPTNEVATYSLGVDRKKDGSLHLKFQLIDCSVRTIVEHEYIVEANFHVITLGI